jgi:RimJ/RimL family protein N-acetyltransferase
MRRDCLMTEFAIETERLILRAWRDGDVAPLHAICSDPGVMAFIGPPQSEAEVRAAISHQHALQTKFGHCYWAIERKADAQMLGFCGLMPMPEAVSLAPCIDIGWRLAATEQRKGYALEAARASLQWGFANLDCESLWAITVWNNVRSFALMDRLGMSRHPDLDFDHPNVPDGSPLKPHISYSINRETWLRSR